ncbi:MAG: zinc ribbon domain-containing protein, partial [Acidaminococcaceae bacterium]|nr:zinc ribbon domain-containing protein [Acidaminococcaceae bacterium]
MHCPNCGQKILEGSDFCSNCGAPVVRQLVGPICAKCGSRNLPEAEFCAECGARLGGESVPMQSFCPECGAAVKESATFCKMCGAKLKEAAAPVQSVCPGCGEALPPDAVFCGNCGMSLEQGGAYASGPATVESDPSYQTQEQEYVQQQAQYQQQAQTQDWEYPQQQQAQPQDQEYPRQEEPYQHQAQPQFQNRESVDSQPQTQLPQKSSRNKMLMAAAAAVILLVVGITGFWKPGYLLDLFRPTAKLENGVLALKDITLDFKQTNLGNGAATMTTVKDKESEEQNGLIGDLYVMKIDKSCQGKVTVAIPVPKEYKPGNNDGQHIKLGIGREYPMVNGKTTRRYSYFDAEVKDGKAVAVIDPAAVAQSTIRNKATEKSAETAPDLGEYTEYVGYYLKYEFMPQYGEGYKYSKGHFRLWYNYYTLTARNHYMGGDDAQKLLSDLEEAYNYYKKNGYADYVDAFTPIDVYIEDIKDEGGWLSSTGEIQLKEKSLFG